MCLIRENSYQVCKEFLFSSYEHGFKKLKKCLVMECLRNVNLILDI